MADFFRELFSNRVLIAGCLGWFIAQVLKTIIYAILNRTMRWERMVSPQSR